MWWIYMDPEKDEWEIQPAREVTIHANIRRFLEDGLPCSDCLKIVGISPGPENTKYVQIKISHPWDENTTFTGFDVRGIAMWNGSEFWPVSGLLTQNPSGSDAYVLNADGYTTIFNPTNFPPGSSAPIFTYTQGKFATSTFPNSTLNPYLDYYIGEERHFFPPGESVVRTWQIRMPSSPPFVLGYAVDASWEPPNPKPPVNVPDDFPISANRAEPYKLQVYQPAPLEPDPGSETTLEISIWDWQNDPGEVWVECPQLWEGKAVAQSMSWDGEKTIAFVPVTNALGAAPGKYRALVGAQDSSTSPPPWDLTAYVFTEIEVGEHVNHPPVAAAFAEQYTAYSGEPVQFHSLATDPDGISDIAQYAWDFTNDGIWDLPLKDPEWIYPLPGVYHVDHKVTDQAGLSDDLEPDELLEVTIYDPCCKNPPIAIAEASATSVVVGELVTLTSKSIDPDGAYCLASAGWDYDGKPGIDKYGAVISFSYTAPGIYEVQLEVKDKCDLVDYLDEPIIIEVAPDCCQEPPVALFSNLPNDVVTGQVVTLCDLSYDPESPNCHVDVFWDLDDDGKFDDGTGEEAKVSWDEAGVHNVSIKAVDECYLEDIYTASVTVHVGVTYPDDASYKVPGVKYSYISGVFHPSEVTYAVDLSDLDGPWDFTQLALSDIGVHRVTLDKNHPEVAPFKNDFTATYEHFYKSSGIYSFMTGPLYLAEEFTSSPDTLIWIGMHEDGLGSHSFTPSIKQPYPFWIFTDISQSTGIPPLFTFDFSMQGYAEGIVKVPYKNLSQFCVVMRSEMKIASLQFSGSALVYEWILDDGKVVAIVSAVNTLSQVNYDPTTKEITGVATFNALDHVGPY